MIKTKFNPINAMIIALCFWILFISLLIPFIIDNFGLGGGGVSFVWIGWSICLLPLPCIIIYNLFILLNRQLTKRNITRVIIINLILAIWLMNSIFAIYKYDFDKLWLFLIISQIRPFVEKAPRSRSSIRVPCKLCKRCFTHVQNRGYLS